MPISTLCTKICVAAALTAALATASADPGDSAAQADRPPAQGDAVLQLLQDKGLVPKTVAERGAAVVRQVRDRASDLVISAMNFLGVAYRRGGNTADEGFDCSGFTRHIFEHSIGLVLPRRADDQARAAGVRTIDAEELRPGDLVFFNTLKRTFSHVGIYIGEGRFIHSPRSGAEVRIEDMRMAYWQHRFTGARRVDAMSPAAPPADLPAASPPP